MTQQQSISHPSPQQRKPIKPDISRPLPLIQQMKTLWVGSFVPRSKGNFSDDTKGTQCHQQEESTRAAARKKQRRHFPSPPQPKTYLFQQKILKLVGRTSNKDLAITNGLIQNAPFSPWDDTFLSDPETPWWVDGTRKRDAITTSDMVWEAPLSSQAEMLQQSGTGQGDHQMSLPQRDTQKSSNTTVGISVSPRKNK